MSKEDREKIEKMTIGGKILAKIMAETVNFSQAGVSTLQIEHFVQELMSKYGVKPSFTKVRDYKFYTCLSINDAVVHGIPTEYRLKSGDLLGIDIGVFHLAYNTDMSWSIVIKDKKNKTNDFLKVENFLQIGRETLDKAIAMVKAGNKVGQISEVIQKNVEKAHFSVVKQLVGHAVGKTLHEYPQIPGVLTKPIEKTEIIKSGMTLAIEIIYTMGGPEIVYKNDDGWTIVTKDASLAGLFEATIAVLEEGNIILTPFNGLLKQAN